MECTAENTRGGLREFILSLEGVLFVYQDGKLHDGMSVIVGFYREDELWATRPLPGGNTYDLEEEVVEINTGAWTSVCVFKSEEAKYIKFFAWRASEKENQRRLEAEAMQQARAIEQDAHDREVDLTLRQVYAWREIVRNSPANFRRQADEAKEQIKRSANYLRRAGSRERESELIDRIRAIMADSEIGIPDA